MWHDDSAAYGANTETDVLRTHFLAAWGSGKPGHYTPKERLLLLGALPEGDTALTDHREDVLVFLMGDATTSAELMALEAHNSVNVTTQVLHRLLEERTDAERSMFFHLCLSGGQDVYLGRIRDNGIQEELTAHRLYYAHHQGDAVLYAQLVEKAESLTGEASEEFHRHLRDGREL